MIQTMIEPMLLILMRVIAVAPQVAHSTVVRVQVGKTDEFIGISATAGTWEQNRIQPV